MAHLTALPEPPIGQSLPIAQGVWWGRLPLPKPAGHVNVYLLQDADGWTLVDAGCSTQACRQALATMLAQHDLATQDLRQVIVTHHHPDHLGLASELQSHGALVLASHDCFSIAAARYQNPSPQPSQASVALARKAGLLGVHLEAYRRNAPQRFPLPTPPASHARQVLQHDDSLAIGPRTWRVLLGFGHAEGHVTLWSDDGLAITGDHFLQGMTTNLTVHADDPLADPVVAFSASCEVMLEHATPETLLLPGHNQPFINVPQRWKQMQASRTAYLSRLRNALESPATALECLQTVHRRTLQPYEKHLLLAECFGHLNHLRDRGLVEQLNHPSGAALWRRTRLAPKP